MDERSHLNSKDKVDLAFNFLGIVASLVVGAASVIIFVYSNFLTRNEYDRDRTAMVQKLDRIDQKLDRIYELKVQDDAKK